MNNEILLPNRCREGHQDSKNSVFTGFFQAMQSFPLVAGYHILTDFALEI